MANSLTRFWGQGSLQKHVVQTGLRGFSSQQNPEVEEEEGKQ